MRRVALVAVVALALVAGPAASASASVRGAVLPPLVNGRPTDETAPSGTVNVSSSTDLVDGEVVSVSGAGWEPGVEVFVATCGDGALPCFGRQTVVADGSGVIVLSYVVRALGYGGVWLDCRIEACHLHVWPRRGDSVSVPLTFVPDGPLPDTGTAAAAPGAALVDGQTVEVTGSGWSSDHVAVEFCARLGRACDHHPRDVDVAPDGTFTVELPARALVSSWGGPTSDCRLVACEVRVAGGDQRAIVPVSFDPLAPLLQPQLAIAPEGTLVNGQVVTVTGSGFVPGDRLLIRQRCYYAPDCGAHVVPDADGNFTVSYQVQDVLDVYHGVLDCRGVPHCAIRAVDPVTWDELASAPLTFAPDGAEQVTVRPTAGLRDGDVVEVAATGLNLGRAVEVAQCVALPGNPFPFPFTDWQCAAPFTSISVDERGEIHTTVTVRSRWSSTTDEHPEDFDCRLDRCRLVVGGPGVRIYVGSTFAGYGTYWNRTPLEFAAASAPASPTAATPAFAG